MGTVHCSPEQKGRSRNQDDASKAEYWLISVLVLPSWQKMRLTTSKCLFAGEMFFEE